MIIFLTDFGYKLSKRGEKIVITYPNKKEAEYLINDIEALYLAGEGRLSKSIIVELTRKNIDVLLLSRTGKPLVYLIPAWTEPKIWKLWQSQLNLTQTNKISLAKKFALKAIKSKADLLTTLSKSRKRINIEIAYKLKDYRNKISEIERQARKVKGKNYEDIRMRLMGLEGYSARIYFETLSLVIPTHIGYTGIRTKRPPKDLFNASISYGYGFLKYFIERELLLNGLNPYYGFLHSEKDKVRSFSAFDIMEGLRHSFVDRVVINLTIRKRVNVKKHSKKEKDAVYLNRNGIKILLQELHKGRVEKQGKIISDEIKSLINFIKS